MIFLRSAVITSLSLVIVFTLSACSDTQNLKKKSSTTINNAVISVDVKSRSTTSGTETTETLDKTIEKAVTKNLSKVLIVGSTDSKLFATENNVSSSQDLPDNQSAKKNSVDVSYSYMASTNKDEELVVADISQSVTGKDGKVTKRSGKIFFDIKGKILGYSFPDTPTSTTPTSKANS